MSQGGMTDLRDFIRATTAGAGDRHSRGVSGGIERGLAIQDAAAAKKTAAEQSAFDRSQAVSKEARAERKDKRVARTTGLSDAELALKVMERSKGTMSFDKKVKMEKALTNYAKRIDPNGIMDPAEKEKKIEKKQRDLMGLKGGQLAPSKGGAATGDIKEGTTATNKQTGQKMIYRGGQWQSV